MNSNFKIDHDGFVWLTRLLLLGVAGALAWAIATSRSDGAIAWGAVAAVIIALLMLRSKLPSLFGLLLAVAATVNGTGYALTLWHDRTMFDEVVHAFTTFAGLAAISWALVRTYRIDGSGQRLWWTLIGIGVLLGVVWEGFEWLIGIIGSPKDTAIDLAMDMLGALAAAALIAWTAGTGRNER